MAHPRVSGENFKNACNDINGTGSSPRERGKLSRRLRSV